MYHGSIKEEHFNYINNSMFSLCDGVGIVKAAKAHKIDITRYHGPDMMLDICEAGQAFGWKHFFLGGKDGVAEDLENKFQEKFTNFTSVGTYCPPFRELTKEEEQAMIEQINQAKPDFLWVSLGLPKQENWIMKYLDKVDAKVFVGVGAAFDFYTGNVKRAPIWYQKNGLEWLYRLAFEPRMFVRGLRSLKFLKGLVLSNKNRF